MIERNPPPGGGFLFTMLSRKEPCVTPAAGLNLLELSLFEFCFTVLFPLGFRVES